jgi:uncharacterized protein (TIGR01244 family)
MGRQAETELKCGPLQESLQDKVAGQTSTVEYRVGHSVVLAGQIQPDDIPKLARQGVRTIVNLRRDPGRSTVEQRNVEALGLTYIHLPLPAYELQPQHLTAFQQAIEDKEGLYIHCRSGTRVALLWMLHRMFNEGWSREDAEAELRTAGYDRESMEVFDYCTTDYVERTTEPTLAA